jgi:hypothetical protein
LAKRLSEELERLGHRAVYDSVALSPGVNWREVLIKELSASDAVVVLITEQALQSPFIMGEIGAARALYHEFGQMLLLPVLMGNLPIPDVVNDLFVIRMSDDQEGIARSAFDIAKKLEDHINRRCLRHPRIFISHRHNDKAIAQALVKVIEAAFEVEPSDLI